MDVKWILNKIKNIIIQSEKEWLVIRDDGKSFNFHIKNFALPLIITLSLATFINMILLQHGFLFRDAILFALINFASSYIGMYVSALLINFLASSFASIQDRDISFKLIIYSSTPIYLASIVTNLLPSLFFLTIFYLYSIYLLWLGLSALLKTPEKNKLGFTIIIVVILFGSIAAIQRIMILVLPVNNTIVG